MPVPLRELRRKAARSHDLHFSKITGLSDRTGFFACRGRAGSAFFTLVASDKAKDVEKHTSFHTTRWSVLLSPEDGGDETKSRLALSHLCRTYWRPVFAFICRLGYSVPDAQDLTQDFFVMILKGDFLEQADPERGRFRSLLLRSLQNFLKNAQIKSEAVKRGGEVELISWDEWQAEAPSRLTVPAKGLENWTAERIFDVRWAATVAERALRSLQEECASLGRQRVFDTLQGALIADREEVSYPTFARELSVSVPEIRNALHRLRQRYRQLLRKEVADTVESSDKVDSELRYLVSALAAGGS